MAASLVLFLTAKDSQALLNLPDIRILNPLRPVSPTPTAQPTLTPRPTLRPTLPPVLRKQRVATQSGIQRSRLPKLRFERAKDFQEVEVLDRRIKIATREGKTKIVDLGVTALVEGGLLYDKGQIKSRKRRPINILPSDVKKKVPGARDLKLIDEDNPKYHVTREIKGKIFGMVPVGSFLTHKINAQTGEIIKQIKPWWWKRFVNEIGIMLDEGEACPFDGPDWCKQGLKCEPFLPVISDTGMCRLFSPAVHGRIFVNHQALGEISVHEMVKDSIGTQLIDVKTYFDSTSCPDQTFEVSMDGIGNFSLNNISEDTYAIRTTFRTSSDPNAYNHQYWKFRVNEGPLGEKINLKGFSYNDNNQIRVVDDVGILAIPCPPEIVVNP